MADVPVFVIGNFEIENAERYRDYEKGFFPVLKRHGGTFYTYDDKAHSLEGGTLNGRVVLLSFPSEEAALGWYNDPGYQDLINIRRESTKLNFLNIVHGMPPRG